MIPEIDVNRLDDEWIKQSTRYNKWAERAADRRREYDESRSNLEVVRAELDRKIRDAPDTYGLAKLTENVVTSTITLQSEFQKAQQAVYDARHDLDVTQAVVGALDHRKTALSKLVDLFLADYFSKPTTNSSDARDMMEEKKRTETRRRGRRDRQNE